ncbi:ABC-2 family transporter protein, partial [Candidatus Microgenomates bacterium]|nr:ABC-2 family transporter protein [Candidatus Microgenomates bacterium]
LLFWQGAFQKRTLIGGWSLLEMRSYYLLGVIAMSVLMAHIEILVAYHDIKEGEIAARLLKPISYLWTMVALETPWRVIQGLIGVVTVFAFIAFGVHIQFTDNLEKIVFGVVISIGAFLVSYFLKMCTGILAFWFTDINALLETQEVLILVFSGYIMPVDLLPWNLYNISMFTPFPYIIYYPIKAFLGTLSIDQMIRIVIVQWVWILLLYGVFKILWKRGVYKFSGVGQ